MYNKESHDTIDERTFVFQDKDYTILHWFSRTAVTGRAGNFCFRGRKSDPKKQSRRGKAVSGKGSEQPETKRVTGQRKAVDGAKAAASEAQSRTKKRADSKNAAAV